MLALILEQFLNGLQYGLMLFLLAAGLTLVFGIMDLINLAHGSLYMIGAFLAAAFYQLVHNFFGALLLAIVATALLGAVLEKVLYQRLQRMPHLSQVLATFALILIANEATKMLFGAQPPLALNTNLHGDTPDNLIRVILDGIDTPARTASVSTDCSSDSSGASRINRATPCCAGESAGSWARKALSRGTENEGMGDTWAANRNERRQCSGSPAPRRLPEGKPPRICKPAVYAQSPFRGQRPGQRDACGALPVHA